MLMLRKADEGAPTHPVLPDEWSTTMPAVHQPELVQSWPAIRWPSGPAAPWPMTTRTRLALANRVLLPAAQRLQRLARRLVPL